MRECNDIANFSESDFPLVTSPKQSLRARSVQRDSSGQSVGSSHTLPDDSFGNGSSDSLPITEGHLLSFAYDPIACMRRQFRQHGRISALQDGQQRIVFVVGPQFNQQVLSDTQTYESRFFTLRGPKNSSQRRLTCGLLSMNGDEHKRHRRLIMDPFSRKSIDRYHPDLAHLAEDMVQGWRPGEVRRVHDDMTRFMLRVTSTIIFGFDRADLAYQIGRKTERWVEANHRLGVGALVRSEQFNEGYEELLQRADELEADIRQMIRIRRSESRSGRDVLSILVRAHDEQGGLTDEELIGQAAVLFGAAHLTTASTLSWTLLLLAQHPAVMRELLGELTSALDGQTPTANEIDSLPYLDRVIAESMRVLPASAYSQRVSSKSVQLGPFRLSRGTPVIFSQFMTHRMPDLYDRPSQFMPDRWLTIKPSPYAYLPFAAGPRMCIGAALAMMILKITLPAILQRFRLTVEPNAEIGGRVISTMLMPTSPIPVRLAIQDGQFASSRIGGNIHDLVDFC